MSTPLPRPLDPFDPLVALATSLHSQRGVYALLIGSGVSTGVGIPTGWGVVEALVRRVAAASGASIDPDGDWEHWWAVNTQGAALGYSSLLEQLAPTAPSRRALLAGFFEPSPEDRDAGLKVPGPAHRAIANLVSAGFIRVIVTTNFDRLLEQAIEAEGVMPQVITTDSAVLGMEPLQHAPVTIIKLHGDYASLDQRNTVDELSSYPEATTALLNRVLDEYGLIVSGWSGDWDSALVDAIEASANRRYPFYWASRNALGAVGLRLTARSTAATVTGITADEFFSELLSRVEAIEQLSEAPVTTAVKLARLKRALPDPVRQLEVRALLEAELDRLRMWLAERSHTPAETSFEEIDAELSRILARTQPLMQLYATGVSLDRDRQHTDLWVWALQRALDARAFSGGTFTDWWDNLAHYPAALLLRAGTMAALVAGHEEVIVRIAGEPNWSNIFLTHGKDVPAHQALHLRKVVTDEVASPLPRWGGTSYRYPSSRLLRADLQQVAVELVGQGGADRLLDRMEYRMALANQLITRGSGIFSAAAGEYLGSWPWRDGEDGLTTITMDFLEHGDQSAWGRTADEDAEFDGKIRNLDARLKRVRGSD